MNRVTTLLASATLLGFLGFSAVSPASATTSVINAHDYWTSVVDTGSGGQRICGVRTLMIGGGELRLLVIGGKVHLVAHHPDWQMRSGESVRVAISVDDEAFRETAKTVDGQTLMVMRLSENFLKQFLDGIRMEADFGGVRWTVSLIGTTAATGDMNACLASARSELMS